MRRGVVPLVSVPLVLEYEAVLTRSEHLRTSGFSLGEVVEIVKAFCFVGEPVHFSRSIRPLLTDPSDEFVIETAVFGKADFIVTFNKRHFEPAARNFSIGIISPSEALERISPQ